MEYPNVPLRILENIPPHAWYRTESLRFHPKSINGLWTPQTAVEHLLERSVRPEEVDRWHLTLLRQFVGGERRHKSAAGILHTLGVSPSTRSTWNVDHRAWFLALLIAPPGPNAIVTR